MVVKPQCMAVKFQHIYGSYTRKQIKVIHNIKLQIQQKMETIVSRKFSKTWNGNYIFSKKLINTLFYFKLWDRRQLNSYSGPI